jgi:hypothetical protein
LGGNHKQQIGASKVSTDIIESDRTNVATRAPSQDRSVGSMLQSADAAADRGDYVEALAWLRRLDAIGLQLDPVYASRRDEWRSKVESRRVGSSQWFG